MVKIKNKSFSLLQKYFPDLIIIISVFLFMVYVRLNINNLKFFGSDIVFLGNDPWYHVRLVENTLHNFPYRTFFDPMTNFPTGSRVPFGPLFTLLIAGAALVIGLGNPDPTTIVLVAAYMPPLLGALTVIPIYLVGKEIGGRKTGILAVLTIATIKGEFLGRSLLGFTDHHVAEILFSIFALWVYIIALQGVRKSGIGFADFHSLNWEKIKRPTFLALGSGAAFSIYLLTWVGAFILALALMVSTVIIAIADYYHGRDSDYVGIVGAGTFLVPAVILIAIVPKISLDIRAYSLTQVYILFILMIAVLIIPLFLKWFRHKNFHAISLPFGFAVLIIIGTVLTKSINPGLFSTMTDALRLLLPSISTDLTIVEARPLLVDNQLNYAYIKNGFGYAFYISIIALIMLIIRSFSQFRLTDIVFMVWSVEMLMLAFAQMRFTYYYAVNAAILVGFLFGLALELSGFNVGFKSWQTLKKYCSPVDILKMKLRIKHTAVLVVFVLLILYPAASSPVFISVFETEKQGNQNWYHSIMNDDWYNSLKWMRYNTPDPGVDYYGKYKYPKNGSYPYLESAYGVLSWWDYGHIITYCAHRIPNTNPFQASAASAAEFFLSKDEDTALKILDEEGTRYIITEFTMVGPRFNSMTIWANDDLQYQKTVNTPMGSQRQYTIPFFQTMVVRLHILDGSETEILPGITIAGQEMLRLVYESKSINNFEGRAIKRIKIFEYVPGARITGSSIPYVKVRLNTEVKTNQGRIFSYSQSTTADSTGNYSFIVPYATTGQHVYDTYAISDYQIQTDNTNLTVSVTEEDVMRGNIIPVI